MGTNTAPQRKTKANFQRTAEITTASSTGTTPV